MLQKCYKLHTFVIFGGDVKFGHFSTRKCIVRFGARNDINGFSRVGARLLVLGYIRAGKLQAGGCKLGAGAARWVASCDKLAAREADWTRVCVKQAASWAHEASWRLDVRVKQNWKRIASGKNSALRELKVKKMRSSFVASRTNE